MTLTAWFREYVLQPLGGQNVWIVWALIGLCYGASLNYLFWGLYIGLLILFERAVLNRYLVKMAPIFRHLYAWLMLLIGWVFFMSPDMGAAFQYLGTMFGIGAAGFADAYTLYLLKSNWLLLLLAAALVFTGVGIAMMVDMRIIPNPPDGMAQAMSVAMKKNLGTAKNILDFCCVGIAAAVDLLFTGGFTSIGVGTVIAMVALGRIIALFNRLFKEKLLAVAGLK